MCMYFSIFIFFKLLSTPPLTLPGKIKLHYWSFGSWHPLRQKHVVAHKVQESILKKGELIGMFQVFWPQHSGENYRDELQEKGILSLDVN